MKKTSISPLRVSTKHNVSEKLSPTQLKEFAYSPLKKSPLRNSVSANDPPSSSSLSDHSSGDSKLLDELPMKSLQFPSVKTQILRHPSPTRTNVSQRRDAALRKSPQRLDETTRKYSELRRPPSSDIPDLKLNPSLKSSRNNLRKRTSTQSGLRVGSLPSNKISCDSTKELMNKKVSTLPKKHKLSYSPNLPTVGCLKSSPVLSRVAPPFSESSLRKQVSFSTHADEIVSSPLRKVKGKNTDEMESNLREVVGHSSTAGVPTGGVCSRDTILKIRSDFNKLSALSQEENCKLKSNSDYSEFIMERLKKHDEALDSLRESINLVLHNQQRIMNKFGV